MHNHSDLYILISMSTPAGKLRFIKESMIFELGPDISIKRLWTLISNCSREFLSIKEDLLTVYLWIWVGKGTGPMTWPPFRSIV